MKLKIKRTLAVALSMAMLAASVPAMTASAAAKEHNGIALSELKSVREGKNEKAEKAENPEDKYINYIDKNEKQSLKQDAEVVTNTESAEGRYSQDMDLSDAEFYESGNWEYAIVNGEATITSFYTENSLSGRVDVPEKIDGYPVTGIYWISCWDGEIDIYLPASIKEIDDGSFGSGIKSINVDANNPYFSSENGVLYNKDKTELLEIPESCDQTFTVPEGVKKIADLAFSYSGITQITLPEGLESIGKYVFTDCYNLTQVNIPASVNQIGKGAFAYCESLTTINISPSNANFVCENGVLFNADKTELKFYLISKTDESYVVPSTVKVIDENAFTLSRIKNIVLPDSLEIIADSAFTNGNLESVTIPASVKEIGEGAFAYNHSLAKVDFEEPSSLKVIKAYAFSDCTKLNKLVLPQGLEKIEPFALAWTDIKVLYIPASVVVIDKLALEYTDTRTIFYGGSASQWNAAVQETDTENYSYEDEWYYIELPDMVYNSQINEQTGNLGENITWTYDGLSTLTVSGRGEMPEYGEYTGASCWADFADYILEINIEEGVTKIDGFYDMEGVELVTLPVSLKEVSGCAFNFAEYNWQVQIVYKGLPNQWEKIEFGAHEDDYCYCVDLSYEYIFIDNENFAIDEIGIIAYDSTSLKFGETVILEADVPRNGEYGYVYLPVGTYLDWYFETEEGTLPFDGYVYGDFAELICIDDGKVCAEVYLVDDNGNVVENEDGDYVMASVTLEGDAGFMAMISYLFRLILDRIYSIFFFWMY